MSADSLVRSVRSRRGRTARVALIAALSLGIVMWLGIRWYRTANTPTDEGRAIAESFLKEIREGRTDSAWSSTTAEFKSFMGREQLRTYVKAHRALKEPATLSDARAVSPNGLSATEYAFRPPAGASASTIRVLLAREQGQWKVERLTVE